MQYNHKNPIEHELLLENLHRNISKQARDKGSLGLFMIYIHDITRINTTLGYESGKRLLSLIAERLATLIRPKDELYRVGEKKFAAIIPGILNKGHATLAANKLQGISRHSYDIDGNSINIHASIGISLSPDHTLEEDMLLRYAELALQSCTEYNNPHIIFSPEKAEEIANQWKLEKELYDALDKGELELYYQPKIHLKSGKVCGAEALMRWNNEKWGLIPPDLFIPIANKKHKIQALTWFAIKTALRQLCEWPQNEEPLSVSVNLTPAIIKNSDVVEIVKDAVKIWGVNPGALTLEITESALMENIETSFNILNQLRAQNVKISIDDFGTGYSSLSYFKNIPANELKIDKSFVLRMLNDVADKKIVNTIINLAHSFSLTVVAEGVEDAATSEALKQIDCDYIQGYFISKPIPQKDFIAWLKHFNKH